MEHLSVILDLSPITNNPGLRSGLARYAYDLGKELSGKVQLGVNASGSIWSTQEVMRVAQQENWKYVGKTVPSWLKSPLASRTYNLIRSTVNRELAKEYRLYHSTYARIRTDVRRHFEDRHILTVHDLTPLMFSKDYFHPNQKAITSRIIDSIKPGDHVITVSENTRQDLINYKNLDPNTIYTVHNGYDPDFFYPVTDSAASEAVLSSFGLDKVPYFMTLSALGKHKNIKTYLDAGTILHQQQPKGQFKLVIAGKPNDWIQELLKEYPSDFITQRVVLTGFIPNDQLAIWYSHCKAFVFPSLYEGFGLPLVEAMACGAPLVYADNSSLKEIGLSVGFACETTNAEMYADAMVNLLADDSICQTESLKSLQKSDLFKSKKWIANTMEVYEKVLN